MIYFIIITIGAKALDILGRKKKSGSDIAKIALLIAVATYLYIAQDYSAESELIRTIGPVVFDNIPRLWWGVSPLFQFISVLLLLTMMGSLYYLLENRMKENNKHSE